MNIPEDKLHTLIRDLKDTAKLLENLATNGGTTEEIEDIMGRLQDLTIDIKYKGIQQLDALL